MKIYGIDPGLTAATSVAVACRPEHPTDISQGLRLERHLPAAMVAELLGPKDIVVLEWPTWQGEHRSKMADAQALGDEAWRLRNELKRKGCEVYTPPVYELYTLPALGWDTKNSSGFDRHLRDRMKAWGLKVGQGTVLNTTHARNAFLCCLWWVHALVKSDIGQKWRVK